MTDGPLDVARIPPLAHDEASTLFAQEMQRAIGLTRSLDPEEWHQPTDCPDWDVRQLYLHVLGATESGASVREFVHQLRAARAHQRMRGGPQEAALTAVQVREREPLGCDELVERLSDAAPRCVQARRRLPRTLRRVTVAVDGPVIERWSLGYLVDVIYLRDAWMHRIDASRAVGRAPQLTPEHDGRIVADVVAEWCRRHGRPVELVLTGPAGGRFVSAGARSAPSDSPQGSERLEIDAVEFCRALSGRTAATGLLTTVVPF
jgi:uncharacterized protein (TIGR03083 family)